MLVVSCLHLLLQDLVRLNIKHFPQLPWLALDMFCDMSFLTCHPVQHVSKTRLLGFQYPDEPPGLSTRYTEVGEEM